MRSAKRCRTPKVCISNPRAPSSETELAKSRLAAADAHDRCLIRRRSGTRIAPTKAEGDQHRSGGGCVHSQTGAQEGHEAEQRHHTARERRHGVGGRGDEPGEQRLELPRRLRLLDGPAGPKVGAGEDLPLVGRDVRGQVRRDPHPPEVDGQTHHEDHGTQEQGRADAGRLTEDGADTRLVGHQSHRDTGDQDEEERLEQRADEGGAGQQGHPRPSTSRAGPAGPVIHRAPLRNACQASSFSHDSILPGHGETIPSGG